MKSKHPILITAIFSFILTIGLLFLDQFTKYLTVIYLKDAPIVLIEDVFSLRYVENRGIGFGLFQGKVPMILILNVIVLVCIIAILIKLPINKRVTPARITLLFTIAGALGNIVDRVRLGYVVDMVSFDFINFPVFNVADIFVTVSIFIFAVLYLFYYKDNEFDNYLFPKKNAARDEKQATVVLEEVAVEEVSEEACETEESEEIVEESEDTENESTE